MPPLLLRALFHGITVLPLGYLQHDAERDAVLSFPADAVRLLHIGAPAVDAADAAGCAQDRHARAARGGQLGDVLGGLDLLRSVGQCAEGKRRVGLFNRQRSRLFSLKRNRRKLSPSS